MSRRNDFPSMLIFCRRNMTYAGIWRFNISKIPMLQGIYTIYSIFVFVYFPIFLTSLTLQFVIMMMCDEEFKNAPQNIFRTITLMITLWTVEVKAKLSQTRMITRIISYIVDEEKKIRECLDNDVLWCYNRQAMFCRKSNFILFSVTMTVAVAMILGNVIQRRQIDIHNAIHNDSMTKHFTYELYYAGLDQILSENLLEIMNDVSVLIAAALVSSTQLIFISCIIFSTSLLKIMQVKFRKMKSYGDYIITLTELITEHQNVISFVGKLNDAMKHIILLEYLLHSLNVASVSLQFIKSEHNISMAFPVCYFGLLVVQTFLLGWNANEVKSLAMADAFWESQWYEPNYKAKQLMLVLLMRMQRPLVLTIGPFDAMTIQSSLTIMKASYSYVTVMI
ncbi:uncharacterized protein LOC132704745 isoform X2 [Cylas formicarius]|uniref:uncharacterized protein LOC132704745 isoform X2 n=1 Tax=Cylas formicarius TaxID=197179 RepID=UPI002958567B|nr:uncharacterized protein LOC132704745 isoform X2 [Cylas formicarius]